MNMKKYEDYILKYCKGVKLQREPQFGAWEHYRKAHGSLLSGEMLCVYTILVAAILHLAILEFTLSQFC